MYMLRDFLTSVLGMSHDDVNSFALSSRYKGPKKTALPSICPPISPHRAKCNPVGLISLLKTDVERYAEGAFI